MTETGTAAGEPHEPTTERLYAANAVAARFYAERLSGSGAAADYLTSHGITAAAGPNSAWQLGYAPGRWTDLANHLRAAGFTTAEATAAGLGFVHRTSRHLLDRFRDRLMFPITDQRNRVVGFTARDLSGRADAKWINTPQSGIYHKRRTLYGLGQQLAHPPAGGGDPVVFLVEGAADVLAMHRMATAHAVFPDGRPVYAVAPCGTSLTREQLALLARALPGAHLILAFDGDTAGRTALNRAYPIAKTWPGQLSGTRLPAGQDPADLLATGDSLLAISDMVGGIRPLAHIRMANTIEDLFAGGHITDPAAYAADRLTAYQAIAELFVDAPHAAREMAEAAADRLGLSPTDVTRGVVEAWEARDAARGATGPPAPGPKSATTRSTRTAQEASRSKPSREPGAAPATVPASPDGGDGHRTGDGHQRPGRKGTGHTHRTRDGQWNPHEEGNGTSPGDDQPASAGRQPAATDPPTLRDPQATVWASARSDGGRTAGTSVTATRHDPRTGITVWALADGIGHHPAAVTTAAMSADIAATVALRAAPAAALHTARAAINAFHHGVHPSQAGDASLIVVAGYPDPAVRHGVRFELAWAGDCRAYTIRAGQLAQITADHTIARQHRDGGRSVPPGSVADLLLTSSVRAGDISLCPLDAGPLLLCNNTVHRTIPDRLLASELAEMSHAWATADRLLAATGAHHARDAAVLLIHASGAPPYLVTTVAPARSKTPTTTGSAAALAKTSFAGPPTQPAGPAGPPAAPPAGRDATQESSPATTAPLPEHHRRTRQTLGR